MLPKEAKEGPGPAARKKKTADPLDHLIWEIGRGFYAYIGLLELILAETGLDRHLRPGMGPLLFALFEEDDCSIKTIGGRVQLSPSTLTGLLDRMEREGLVDRRRDPDDGRVVRVRLTALGRSLEPSCHEALGIMDGVLRAGLGRGDILQTKRLLCRLTGVMQEEEEQRRRQSRQQDDEASPRRSPRLGKKKL